MKTGSYIFMGVKKLIDADVIRACSVSFQKKEKVVKYNKVKPRKRAKG